MKLFRCHFFGSPCHLLGLSLQVVLLISNYTIAQNSDEKDSLPNDTTRLKVFTNIKNLILCSILLLFSGVTLAQNIHTIDSLKKVLKTSVSGTKKVDIYNSIAKLYRESDSIQVAHYTNKAIQLAKRVKYPKGISTAYVHLGWISLIKGNYKTSINSFQEALKIADSIQFKKGIADAHAFLGVVFTKKGEYAQALLHYERANTIHQEINDKEGLAYGYNNRGDIYRRKGEYPIALEYYQQSLKIFKKIKIQKGIAYNYFDIGHVFRIWGNHSKAIEYFQKSLTIGERTKDKRGIAGNYFQIGLIHQSQGNYSKALEMLKKSLRTRKEIGEKEGMAVTYNNIGDIHRMRGNFKKALEMYQKSLKIKIQIGDKGRIAVGYLSLGQLALSNKEIEVAKKYFTQALTLRQKLAQKDLVAEAKIFLGIAYYSQKSYKKAEKNLTQGISVAKRTNHISSVRNGAKYLSKLYEIIGKPQKALENHVLYKQMEDSLFNRKNTRQITQLQERYDAQKREDSLKQHNAHKLLQAQIKTQKANKKTAITIFGLISLGVLFIVLVFFYRLKQLNNQRLQSANKEIKAKSEIVKNKEINSPKPSRNSKVLKPNLSNSKKWPHSGNSPQALPTKSIIPSILYHPM